MRRIKVGLAAALVAATLAGCTLPGSGGGSGDNGNSGGGGGGGGGGGVTTTKPPISSTSKPVGHTVVVTVSGGKFAPSLTWRYLSTSNIQGGESSINKTLPYSATKTDAAPGTSVTLDASSYDAPVSCTITVDGRKLADQHGDARGVSCEATVPK